MNFQPNELFNQMALFYSQNKSEVNPENGRKALVKIANQGSSRSGKTYSAIQFIYTFCNHNLNKGLYIAVLRETLVDCRKYTYKDFIECFKMMGVYENCEITEYPNPRIKLYGNTIEFMGLPEPNKQPPRTDICFFNEIVEVNDKQRVNGLLMRCEKLAIFDWNPSYTDHWIFGMESEFNTLFTRTSYLDNKHLSDNIVSNIESYCPWHFDDCHMEIRNGFYVRVWDKPEKPDNCKPEDAHLYRRDNETNIKAGTANKWYWLVYGEGVPAAKEGAIFDPDWIDEFPETGMDSVNLSLDFGYTSDPSVLTRVGVNVHSKDAFMEALTYQATKDVDTLFDLISPQIEREIARRKAEAGWYVDESGKEVEGLEIAQVVIACDSADRYKDIQFVRDLNSISLQRGLGWQFVKVKKPSITVRIALMHRFRLHIVRDVNVQREAQNYCYQVIEGRQTNIPIDNFNHFWDSVGYCFWYFYRWLINI
jgi:phage terminase large subunit